MKRRLLSSRGGAILETALWLPLLFLLMMGTVELGRVVYTYHQLHKVLSGLARYIGTQQGVNFCDEGDTLITEAKQLALTGTTDGSGQPFFRNLTADQIRVSVERFSREADTLAECDCSATATGCDTANGAPAPDYVVVSIPDGYPVQLLLPGLQLDPIPLRPVVRLPYGGT